MGLHRARLCMPIACTCPINFQIPKFPHYQFPKFQKYQVSNFPDSQISKSPKLPHSQFSISQNPKIPKFQNSQIPEFSNPQIPKSRNPTFSYIFLYQHTPDLPPQPLCYEVLHYCRERGFELRSVSRWRRIIIKNPPKWLSKCSPGYQDLEISPTSCSKPSYFMGVLTCLL